MPWGPKNLQKIFLSPTNFLLLSQSKMRSDAPAQLHDMSMDIIWLKQAISMTMGSYCVNVLLYLQENRPPCFDSEVFFFNVDLYNILWLYGTINLLTEILYWLIFQTSQHVFFSQFSRLLR